MTFGDILLGLVVLAAIAAALKFIGHTRGCGGDCSECRHPCHARSGRS